MANCTGGMLPGELNIAQSHKPARITYSAKPFQANNGEQLWNIPAVEVTTTVNSITVTVGGVAKTFTPQVGGAVGADVYLVSGDYDPLTGILSLAQSNNVVVAIPFGLTTYLKCDGTAFDPALDRIQTCTTFANSLCTAIQAWPYAGDILATTELLGKDCRTYTVSAVAGVSFCAGLIGLSNTVPIAITSATAFIPMLNLATGNCFAASLCDTLSIIDTATDATVPATAEVVYVRADGTCGRAALPATVAGGITTATDSTSFNFTVAGTDVTGSVIVSALAGNQLTSVASGLFVPSLCTMLTALDTATDANVPATAEVVYVRADGTCGRAILPVTAAGGITTATDSTSINFTVAGTDVTGSVIVSALAGNQLTSVASGLFVPSLCTMLTALDTATDATVPATAEVSYVRADGTCGRAPLPATVAGGITTATDSTSINFTITGTDVTGSVIVSALAGNQLTSVASGLFVPAICTMLNTLDTATDLFVPDTADVVYVRADGTCGRAILEGLCKQITALDTATDATVPTTAEVPYVRADGTCGRAVLPTSAGGGFSTTTDTSTITWTVTGADLAVDVVIDATIAGNALVDTGDGLYVPDLCTGIQGLTTTTPPSATTVEFPWINRAGGACGSAPICSILSALDTATDTTVPSTAEVIYVRADGTCGRAPIPTTAVTLSTDPDNVLNIDLTGLYAPTLCRAIDDLTQLDPNVPTDAVVPYLRTDGLCGKTTIPTLCEEIAALDGVIDTPTGVPATAQVPYLRADGTCGKALLPPVVLRLSVQNLGGGNFGLFFDRGALGLIQIA